MKRRLFPILGFGIILLMAAAGIAQAPITETQWGGPATKAYEEGFVQHVQRLSDGGVCLFGIESVENDAAGAGRSEKGVYGDVIWGPNRARKVLRLADPRAKKAFIVIFTHSGHHAPEPKYPLTFTVNGEQGQITKDNRETYRWVEFPTGALQQGDNVIELSCPEAQSEEEGWDLYLARADEFEAGGGDPAHVGETSFKSTDGGTTWKESPFGPDGDTRAEYSVRMSLDRYLPKGELETPIIDLWRGDGTALITPLRALVEVAFEAEADVPADTSVTYFLRRGTSPSPYDDDWGEYEEIGSGATLGKTIDGETFNRRYAQLKAVLRSENPLETPVVRTMRIRAKVKDNVPTLEGVFVTQCENPVIRYPSVAWEWESWDRPEFLELRERENLDELIAGARTQFEAQVRLMDYATKRWLDGGPLPEYPAWDALDIVNRIDKAGSGGMCIQGNNFLAGMCMAYGWQARLVNITSHETCEVWNDDYGKWIYLDGYYVNHYIYDAETGEPLSMLEMHQRYLDKHYPNGPIDWMKDQTWRGTDPAGYGVGLGVGGPRTPLHNGIDLAAFMRMVPRNNWYDRPFPRPLAHGCVWWPWDGYINWYDARTPPKRQYSHHTDRPQDMWPDLNKVHVHVTSANANDRLFLRFETYTPNFAYFEVNVDEWGWKETGERWTWFLNNGRNTIRVRAVSHLGVAGKPAFIDLNRVMPPED